MPRLEAQFREQLQQFGIVMSDEEVHDYLKTLPVDAYMNEYLQAVYIRANNKMFEDILNMLKESADV